jgi:hypothetical protein
MWENAGTVIMADDVYGDAPGEPELKREMP